jgi:hypothetical protein
LDELWNVDVVLLFCCCCWGSISGAKSPEELFLSPEGSKMVGGDSSKKHKFTKREKDACVSDHFSF